MSEGTLGPQEGGELYDAPPVPQQLNEDSVAGEVTDMNMDLILNVPVNLSIEIGRTSISIGDLMKLTPGSVIELDRRVGDPHDVLVNGTLIAHGEIVVVKDKFGIRFTDIVSPVDRVKGLN
jgi:flagellar motor switch protein FliN/FliY